MTTFLFASVCVSGIKVISIDGFSRRTRFILAVSLGLGFGVTLVRLHLHFRIPNRYLSIRSRLVSHSKNCDACEYNQQQWQAYQVRLGLWSDWSGAHSVDANFA